MPPKSDDAYLGVLTGALALLASNREGADVRAASLALKLPPRLTRRAFSKAVTVEIFRRDRFACRYCGSCVVPTPVLCAASLLWPRLMPYNVNWRSDVTHPIYSSRSATIDHLVSFAHGGSDIELNNLVTACWPCNTQKSDFGLGQLGWSLLEIPDIEWDGLVAFYPTIWSAVRAEATESDVRFHTAWLAAFS